MEGRKVGGIILGVIGLLCLLYPVALILYPFYPSDYYRPIRVAGAEYGMILWTIPGAILVGLSRLWLKRSIVFGALFIFAGLLSSYIYYSGMLYFSDPPHLLLYAPPLIPILIGVSLIVPLGRLAQ